jgi:hypothetical protein
LLLPGRWRATARGFGAATAIGSGHYRNVRPQPAQDRLLRVDVLSGRTRKLAAGPFVDLEVSHDGRHVALIESDGDIPMSAGHAVQGEYGLERLRHRVRLLDLASGALTSPQRAVAPRRSLKPSARGPSRCNFPGPDLGYSARG